MTQQDRTNAIVTMLAEASREELSGWCELIWDRQLEMDVAALGDEEFQRRLSQIDAKLMSPMEAMQTALQASQSTARKLVSAWIERERAQRQNTPTLTGETVNMSTLRSEATKACRRELQEAFRLVSTPTEVAEMVRKNEEGK